MKRTFQLLISIGFLFIIYTSLHLPDLLESIKNLSILTFLSLCLLYALGQALSAYKWSYFLRAASVQRPYKAILKSYFLGMFVNTFGFGTVGGDVTRALALRPEYGKRSAALASVIADRAHGLSILLAIGATSAMIVRPPSMGPLVVEIAIAVLLLAALGWLVAPRILMRMLNPQHKIYSVLENASTAFSRDRSVFLQTSTISIVFHSLQICMYYLISRSLELPLSLAVLFAVIPITNVMSALPLSINGLGLREASLIFLLLPLGVTKEQAVALGAVWIVVVTVVSAVCGLISSGSTGHFLIKSPKDAPDEILHATKLP